MDISVGQDLYTDRLLSMNSTNARELRNIYGVSHFDGEKNPTKVAKHNSRRRIKLQPIFLHLNLSL